MSNEPTYQTHNDQWKEKQTNKQKKKKNTITVANCNANPGELIAKNILTENIGSAKIFEKLILKNALKKLLNILKTFFF